MTDRPDEDKQADEQGPRKRRRARIYAERITVSLRLEPELHQRMMDLCDSLQRPANTYIIDLIKADLKNRKR